MNQSDFQVIVVGAGPAGCAAAFDLAKAGVRVAILETRTFPRTKPCGGALTTKALRALRFSVRPVVRNIVTDFVAGRELTRETRFHASHPIGAMTVRSELDQFVLEKTLDAGATLVKIGRLTSIAASDEAVKIETDVGCFSSLFAIGADGANSTVRRLTGKDERFGTAFAIEAHVPSPDAFLSSAMTFDFGVVPRGYGWVFPKGDHYNVGLYTYDARFKLFPPQLKAYVKEKLGADDVQQLVGHSIGLGAGKFDHRGRRVFLVGDAGGFCEPVLGEGIYYAIRSGQMAAAAITDDVHHGRSAEIGFRERSAYLRSDLRTAHYLAVRFYRDLGIGYLALISPPIRYALMRGYSLGVPLGHIPALTPLLPLRRVEPVASLSDIAGSPSD